MGNGSWREFERMSAENIKLKDENRQLKSENGSLLKAAVSSEKKISKQGDEINRLKGVEKENQKLKAENHEKSELIRKYEAMIAQLESKLAYEEALKHHDSTNTGKPTSQTPVGKKKYIPNSREASNNPVGGQVGHEQHLLSKPDEESITDRTDILLPDGSVCPSCGSSDLIFTGNSDSRYEYDVNIGVKRRKVTTYEYNCADCGTLIWTSFPPTMKAECQYGANIQALALSLMNTVNVPINKVSMFLAGMTGGEIRLSWGYIAKLQKRGAKALAKFRSDLRLFLIRCILIYWDETVIMIATMRACLRFYGNEKIAYYTAHMHKDMDSIDEDGILQYLTDETTCMHDHCCISYNPKFIFKNIECNQHLQRDLQKSADDTGHKELLNLKNLISATIHERKEKIEAGETSFDDAYRAGFKGRVSEILSKAEEENTKDYNPYSGKFEKNLIKRIREYYDNYFAWVDDFALPTTDNLSERALRGVKSHMKISGQFQNEKTADYYATIKTYVETCRRNGINEMSALSRLCAGNPYTVDEIFHTASP